MIKSRIQELMKENIVAYVSDEYGFRGLTESEYKRYLDERPDYEELTLEELEKELKDLK